MNNVNTPKNIRINIQANKLALIHKEDKRHIYHERPAVRCRNQLCRLLNTY
jgi:hypothetical protein